LSGTSFLTGIPPFIFGLDKALPQPITVVYVIGMATKQHLVRQFLQRLQEARKISFPHLAGNHPILLPRARELRAKVNSDLVPNEEAICQILWHIKIGKIGEAEGQLGQPLIVMAGTTHINLQFGVTLKGA